MIDPDDIFDQALKDLNLEEMPVAGDPLRALIAQRVFELFQHAREGSVNSSKPKKSRLEVLE